MCRTENHGVFTGPPEQGGQWDRHSPPFPAIFLSMWSVFRRALEMPFLKKSNQRCT